MAAEFLLPGCAPLLVAGEGAPAAGVAFTRALRALLAAFTGVRAAGVAVVATRCVAGGGGGGGGGGVPGAPPPAAVAAGDPSNADPAPGALGDGWALPPPPAARRRRAPGATPAPPAPAYTGVSLLWTRLPPAFPPASYSALCPLSLAAPPACVADRLNALAAGSAFWGSPAFANGSAPLRAGAAAVMGAWLALLVGGGAAPPALVCGGGGDAPLCGLLLAGGGAVRLPAAGAAAAVAAGVGAGAGAGAGGATETAWRREEIIGISVGATAGAIALLLAAGVGARRWAAAARAKRVAALAGPRGPPPVLPPSLASRGARTSDGRVLVGRGASAAPWRGGGGGAEAPEALRAAFSASRARAFSGSSALSGISFGDGSGSGGSPPEGVGGRPRAGSSPAGTAAALAAALMASGAGGVPRARAPSASTAQLAAALSPFAASARRSVRGASLLASLEAGAGAGGGGWGGRGLSVKDIARSAAAATAAAGGGAAPPPPAAPRARALSAAERAAAVPADAFWRVHAAPDGRAYFANAKTGAVQWQAPPARPTNLPPGWAVKMSSSTGAAYFRNEERGVSSWELPAAAAGAGGEGAGGERGSPPVESSPALPPGWTQAFSKRAKRPYYYNKATKETRWEVPHD